MRTPKIPPNLSNCIIDSKDVDAHPDFDLPLENQNTDVTHHCKRPMSASEQIWQQELIGMLPVNGTTQTDTEVFHRAIQLSNELLGPQQEESIKALEAIKDKVLVLVDRYVGINDAENALTLAGNMAQFLWMAGHQREGVDMMGRVLGLLEQGSKEAQALALAGAGSLHYAVSEFGEARQYYDRAIPLLKENTKQQRLLAHVFDRRGMVARQQMDLPEAISFHSNALAILEKMPDTMAEQGLCHNNLGVVFFFNKELDQAAGHYDTARNFRKQAGDERGIASSLTNLAQIFRFQAVRQENKIGFAQQLLDQAFDNTIQGLQIRKDLGDTWGVAGSHVKLADIEALRGDIGAAKDYLSNAIAGFFEVKDIRLGFCECLEAGAEIAMAENNHGLAMTLFESATLRRNSSQSPGAPVIQDAIQKSMQHLGNKLESADIDKAIQAASLINEVSNNRKEFTEKDLQKFRTIFGAILK
jgi:tetratricopeptide (TPR) repeat protein